MNKVALILGLLLTLCAGRALADVSTNPYPFSTTQASGTLGPWPTDNATNCTVTVTTNGGSSTGLTVEGASDSPNSAAYTPIPSFGTLGTITPSTNTQYNGNVASIGAKYVEVIYSNNGGTLSGSFGCSGGIRYAPFAPTPGLYVGIQQLYLGTGTTLYAGTMPDNPTTVSQTSTAAVVLISAPATGTETFVYYVGAQATGSTNAGGSDIQLVAGTCAGSLVHDFFPGHNVTTGTAGGQMTVMWGGGGYNGPQQVGIIPALWPIIVPAGDVLCGLSTGTVALSWVLDSANHAVP